MVLITPLMCWRIPILVKVVARAAVVVVSVYLGLPVFSCLLLGSCVAPLDVL